MDSSGVPPRQAPAAGRAIKLTINRRAVEQTIPVYMTLAELVRDRLGLTGTKIACNQAACGACTVLLDGQPTFACHTLAVQATGAEVLTIEGLSTEDELHPLQQAFIDHDAMQCGFCTPGMIMALKAAMDSGVEPDRSSMARAISGNICRCGAYEQILDAAVDVASKR